jgi:hypothetical protein
VLESGDHLLFIRWYDHRTKQEVPKAHSRIWKLLARYGDNPDAPGSITVICLWGIEGGLVQRYMKVYDWTGESEVRRTSDDAIKAAISKWYHDSRGRSRGRRR